MIYEFRCPVCSKHEEVFRYAKDASDPLQCSCGTEMLRVWNAPNISIVNYGYWDHGLGTYVNSKSDITEAQRKYKDRTGSELIDVGTDRINTKPIDHEIKFSDKETKDIYQRLEAAGVQGE